MGKGAENRRITMRGRGGGLTRIGRKGKARINGGQEGVTSTHEKTKQYKTSEE